MEVIYLKGQQLHIDDCICSAIGFFDGLHIGHMALVNEVKKVSRQKGLKTALMTFDHSPLYVLGKLKEEKSLTTIEDRIHILENEGIDYLFVIHFTKDVASLSPQQFVDKYIIAHHIVHLVCGFDFRFAYQNSGDLQFLSQCSSFSLSVVNEVLFLNEKISSTRIRQQLLNGDMEYANVLLGRTYSITGQVIKGRMIGHTIGFPTANVDYRQYFLPSRGVYAVKVRYLHHEYMGMCNIGFNPTFEALNRISMEIHIFDFHEDIYGETIEVYFYQKIRDELTFENGEALISQLQKDKLKVEKYFSEYAKMQKSIDMLYKI